MRALVDAPMETSSIPWPALRVDHLGKEVSMIFQVPRDVIAAFLAQRGARHVEVLGLTLEDIFIARTSPQSTALAA